MTIRSVALGLLGAAAICSITFFNDRVLKGTFLIGNNLPVAVYGLLLIFVMAINPILKKLALTGKEIAVILALTLAACTIPSSGLLRTFPGVLNLPHHLERTRPGWQGQTPWVELDQVRDWQAFGKLLGKGEGKIAPLTALLPEKLVTELKATEGEPSIAIKQRVLTALNELIRQRQLIGPFREGLSLPSHVEAPAAKDPQKLSQQHADRLGRAVLDTLLEGQLLPRKAGIIERVPAHMLADTLEDEKTVLDGMVLGLGSPGEPIESSDVPWKAWSKTLLFWVPFILTLWGAVMALSLLVHRQWSKHEHLPYPIATFADSLLPEKGGFVSAVFRNRMFWVAAGIVFAIHLNNYAAQWFPNYMVPFPTEIDLRPIADILPVIVRGGGRELFKPTIFFIAVGIAFFIPQEVSFSFGIGPFLWAIVVGVTAGYGVSLNSTVEGTSTWMGVTPRSFVTFGACLGVFLSILYTGRRYYKAVLLKAVCVKTPDEVKQYEAWAGRALIILSLLFVFQLAVLARVGFVVAALYTVVFFVGAVVTARVIAETGLFHIQIMLFPCVVIWGLLGVSAIGLRTVLVLQLVSMVLLIDPREMLMPFMANSLKLLEKRTVKLGRATLWCVAALVIGLGVGLPVTMYVQYNYGLTGDYWAENMVPRMPFDNAVSVQHRLEARGVVDENNQGALEQSHVSVSRISPNKICLWAMIAGLGLALGAMIARLRWHWWPIHPLLFALWATNHIRHFAGAFFLGWLIKVLVTKYAGSNMYDRLKPVMIGLIAGEILGAVAPCIVGVICWAITGEMPKSFRILPG